MKDVTPLPPAVIVWSGKGGVGKSTVAAQTARGLAALGVRTGYLDADLHGPSAATLFGVEERLAVRGRRIVPTVRDGVAIASTSMIADPDHAYVWRGPLMRGVLSQLFHDTDWTCVDVLVVDMPPGTGEIQMQVLSDLTCLGAVVVTTPQDLSLADVRRSARMLLDADVPVTAVVENMASVACPSCACSFPPLPGDAGQHVHAIFPEAEFVRLPMSRPSGHTDPLAQALRPLVEKIADSLRLRPLSPC
ncbi:Mrp/NBP35 family ATP-binding protein [Streptomyces sp. NPDC048623]|uniref:Mrp/NBP35 family ATP-binding protein n=1 Tax=Streptomyces sp. NPDC048623 TaxID=3155761 RepID=UPI00341AF3E8